MKCKLLVLFFTFTWTLGVTQSDVEAYVDTIQIHAESIQQKSTGSITVLLQKNEVSLCNQLERTSSFFMKNYGLGSLSTPSARGGSANHTLVLWNGLPLRNPMLGSFDYSLVSGMIADESYVELGGGSTLWGSGAVAASIALENVKPRKTSLSLSNSYGSFNTWQNALNFEYTGQQFSTSTKYIREASNRNYPYTLSNGEERRLKNGNYYRHNVLQDIYRNIGKNNVLEAHIWFLDAHTQIPNTSAQKTNTSYQDDRALRSQIGWKNIGTRRVSELKIGYFDEELIFYDQFSIRGGKAKSTFNTLFAEAKSEWKLNANEWLVGLTHSTTDAKTDGYKAPVQQNNTALFVSHKYGKNNLEIQSSVRASIVDGVFIPLVGSVGANYIVSDALMLKSKISKDYRLPTLNDLHWRPGGNPELLSENGWSGEVSAVFDKEINALQVHHVLTVYNRNIDNWILWAPSPEGYWSPTNITHVWSRGMENTFDLSVLKERYQWQIGFGHTYSKSTTETNHDLPKLTKGEQLIYAPVHTWNANGNVSFASFTIEYNHRYSSMLNGVRSKLAPFSQGTVALSKKLQWKKLTADIRLNIKNLWNRQNYIIEYRPLPKRHYNFTILLKY